MWPMLMIKITPFQSGDVAVVYKYNRIFADVGGSRQCTLPDADEGPVGSRSKYLLYSIILNHLALALHFMRTCQNTPIYYMIVI